MKLNHEADIDERQEAEQLTKVLQVNSDLVHPSSEGPAQDHAGRAVEAEPLKLGPAILSAPDSDQDGKQQSFPLFSPKLAEG